MITTLNYGLIWIGFSEEISARISNHKNVKNILECPSQLLQDPGAFCAMPQLPFT